jgi:membrane dipeptidase
MGGEMDLIDDRDAIDHDESSVRMVADGHVHITNRVYWEGIDTWQPQPFGFDYARAAAGGVNVVIENIAPYGFRKFNYTPKQTCD